MEIKSVKKEGLGGWLIVWIIYSSIPFLVMLFASIVFFISLIIGEILIDRNIFLAVIGAGLYIWMFINYIKKSKNFTKSVNYFLTVLIIIQSYYIGFEIGTIINGNCSDTLFCISGVLGGCVPIIINFIWMRYLKKSKRVKNTFVN